MYNSTAASESGQTSASEPKQRGEAEAARFWIFVREYLWISDEDIFDQAEKNGSSDHLKTTAPEQPKGKQENKSDEDSKRINIPERAQKRSTIVIDKDSSQTEQERPPVQSIDIGKTTRRGPLTHERLTNDGFVEIRPTRNLTFRHNRRQAPPASEPSSHSKLMEIQLAGKSFADGDGRL